MKLLIAGGGTGGHVFPALAVAREWLKRGPEREVVFVGTERGMEARLVPEAGLPLETVRAAGLKRSEEHTSELQSRGQLVCRLLLEKKKNIYIIMNNPNSR